MSFALVGVKIIAENATQFVAGLQSSQRAVRRLGQEARQAAAGTNTLTKSTTTLQGTLKGLSASLGSAGSRMTSLGFRVGAFIALPLASALTAATKAALGYESAMTKILTLTNANEVQVAAWREELVSLAPTLGKTPEELANGLFAVASAGLVGKESLEVLTAASKASSLGLGDLEGVARAITGVVQAYGPEVINAAQATDTLVGIVREGNVEVATLPPVLGRVLGAANELGVGFDEVGAFISNFTRSGASAAVAGTALRSMLTNIIKPSTASKEALASVGISIEEVRGSIESAGLARTLIGIRKAFEGNDEGFARFVGSARAAAGVLFNTSAEGEDYLEVLAGIQSSNGAVEESFETLSQTVGFQLEQLKSSFSVLKVAAGEALLPIISEIVTRLIPMALAIAEVVKNNPQIVALAAGVALVAVAFTGFLVIGGTVISILGGIVSGITAATSVIGFILSPIGAAIAAFVALGAIISGLFLVSLGQIREKTALTTQNVVRDMENLRGSTKVNLVAAANQSDKASQAIADNLENNLSEATAIANKQGMEFTESMSNQFNATAQESHSWGANIVIQFARGMANAAIAVVNTLISIGNTIRTWLRPGSPPKLLPDLPQWGKGAIDSYLSGWAEADFDVFNDVAGTIESLLGSLSEDIIPEVDVVPAILGSREALSSAVNEFEEFGKISQSTMDAITQGFGGDLTPVISGYTRNLFKLNQAQEAVASAQREINNITDAFEKAVAPINAELDGIARRRQEVKDELRATELQGIIDDQNAPELAKELALMELREIELKKQLQAEEDVRDTAMDSADAKLEAAETEASLIEEQVNAQKALIDSFIDQNNLIKRQIELLEQLAEAATPEELGGAGGAGDLFEGGGLGGLIPPGMGDDPFGFGDPFGEEGIFAGAQDAVDEIEGIFSEIQDAFAPLMGDDGLVQKLGDVWSDVFMGISQGLLTFAAEMVVFWGPDGTLVTWLNNTSETLTTWLEDTSTGMTEWLNTVSAGFSEKWVSIFGSEGWIVTSLNDTSEKISTWISDASEGFTNWITEQTTSFTDGFLSVWGSEGTIITNLTAVKEAIVTWATDTKEQFNTWVDEQKLKWEEFKTALIEKWDEVKAGFEDGVLRITTVWRKFRDFIDKTLGKIKSSFEEKFQPLIDFITNAISWVERLTGAIGSLRDEASKDVDINVKLPNAKDMGQFAENSPQTRLQTSLEMLSDFLNRTTFEPRMMLPVGAGQQMATASIPPGLMAGSQNGGRSAPAATFGDTHINNGMDQAMFEARVRRVVASSIG